MRRDDQARLRHMLDAACEAISFSAGRSRGDLDVDRKLALSLVKEIEIIGEAACRVSTETRGEYPSVPWPDLMGMRNRLIHAYFDINLDMVWQTVVEDLPLLRTLLEGIPSHDPGTA